MKQWIIFIYLIAFIPFQQPELAAVSGMFGANARYPYFFAGQRPSQGFNFPDKTAFLPVFHRFIKSIGTLLIHVSFQSLRIRDKSLNGDSVLLAGGRPDGISFTEQASGIEGKNRDGQVCGCQMMKDY